MTELHIAAYFGCSLLVKQYLHQGIHVEIFSKFYGTPLCAAVLKEQKEVVEILLDAGANIEARDDQGLTILNVAVRNRNIEIVELLLRRGANVNSACQLPADEYGRVFGITPLLIAISGNNHMMAKILLNYGANVDLKGYPGGFAPIHLAAVNGDQEMFELLSQYQPNLLQLGNSNSTVLMAAVKGGHLGIVKSVLNKYRHLREIGSEQREELNIDFPLSDGTTPLEMSLQHQYDGSNEIADLLVAEGADIELITELEVLPFEIPVGATPDQIKQLLQEYEGKSSMNRTDGTSEAIELSQPPDKK